MTDLRTELHAAEARLALVAAISEKIAAIDDPAELLFEVSCAVGAHLRVRRALFTEIDLDSDRGIVRRDYCREVHSVAGVYKVSDYAESTRREMQAGRIVVNNDAMTDPRTAAQYEKTYALHGERSYVAVPLLRDGRWVAELWISDDTPRRWSEQDVALLQSVAERVWTAVEKLRVLVALRESEARMQFIAERAAVGYWYWDVPADHLEWSAVCRDLFGIPHDTPVTYAHFLEAVHPDDRERVDAAVRESLHHEEDFEMEMRTLWPNGTVRWVQSKGSATFERGAPARMAGIVLDITPRKLLELEREELLAREIRLRAAADEANLAKDHFLALLSHELRTPMTSILGWASFLGSGMAGADLIPKGIASIEQASRVQARLIDDLLDVSRIVAGKLTLEKTLCDVTSIARTAVAAIVPEAMAKELEVTSELEHPALVEGDATRIQQVISNLLSNAVKFTPSGGGVHIAVHEMDGHVEIRVRDTGLGIHTEFLPYVFETFRQAEGGPSRRFGGLGLGLSIVRRITELHGGTVDVTSDGPGTGAEFVVRLPRTRGTPAA